MTFGERMKELLDQGVAVSKDIASKAGEKAQEWGEKGYKASKDLINKAGARAQDMGERGVLMLEIKRLEGRAQKLLARLGAEVYSLLAERQAPSVSADDETVRSLLADISSVRESIEKREADLQSRQDPGR
jgi:hypothetical protein